MFCPWCKCRRKYNFVSYSIFLKNLEPADFFKFSDSSVGGMMNYLPRTWKFIYWFLRGVFIVISMPYIFENASFFSDDGWWWRILRKSRKLGMIFCWNEFRPWKLGSRCMKREKISSVHGFFHFENPENFFNCKMPVFVAKSENFAKISRKFENFAKFFQNDLGWK